MTKVQAEKATKYLNSLKQKLESGVTKKHEGHPKTYKAFLEREIKVKEAELADYRLEAK